jgi:hypothetical protein
MRHARRQSETVRPPTGLPQERVSRVSGSLGDNSHQTSARKRLASLQLKKSSSSPEESEYE